MDTSWAGHWHNLKIHSHSLSLWEVLLTYISYQTLLSPVFRSCFAQPPDCLVTSHLFTILPGNQAAIRCKDKKETNHNPWPLGGIPYSTLPRPLLSQSCKAAWRLSLASIADPKNSEWETSHFYLVSGLGGRCGYEPHLGLHITWMRLAFARY